MCGFTWVIRIRPFKVQPQCESRPATSVGIDVHHHCTRVGTKTFFFFLIKSVSPKPFTSRSHHSWLRLCIHTLLCNQTAAVAPQRAITAAYILLLILPPSIICFKIRLFPWRRHTKMKFYWPALTSVASMPLLVLCATSCCFSAHVGPFGAVTGSRRSQVLQDSVNSDNKTIRSRKKSEVSRTVTVVHQASVPVNES